MKAMILAAGRGKRMQPLTDTTPKPLLKIADKPLIQYHIEKCSLHGIRDIIINVAHLGQQIIDMLGDGKQFGVNIRYSQEPTGGLETGGGIYKALPLLTENSEDQPFMVINADIWTDFQFKQLPTSINGLAHLILVNNPTHHPQGDFYLNHNNWVTLSGNNSLTFSGISVIHPHLFKTIKSDHAAFFPLAPLLKKAIANQQVSGKYYAGLWSDVGTPERLKAINKEVRATRSP